MLYLFLDLLISFLDPVWMEYWFFPMIGLMFLCTVPRLIRSFVEWR